MICLHTLREEILAGGNFGGSIDPPNPEQFGGIYFGGSREQLIWRELILADQEKIYIRRELILADSPNIVFFKKEFDRKKKQSTLNGKKKTPM